MHSETISTSEYQNLPIEGIFPSTTNPRRTFDQGKLDELAESIRTSGLIQPIIVRMKESRYEIVAGERRWRATKIAQKTEIPAIVRDLTDDQALEFQIVENAQRQDVHPYEEAAGYQKLLERPGYDVVVLAVKSGKSQSHIYSRLSLLQLIPEIAEAFQLDKITASHANLIARLPQEQQTEAFKACWRTDYRDNNEPHLLPAKHLASWIDNNVYLPLSDAPFSLSDPTLSEEAGSCENCPSRTGFNSLLFEDANGDMCLKAACYHGKVSAHVKQALAAHPELVQIATDFGRNDNPAVLARFAYNEIAIEGHAAEIERCEHTRDAIVALGDDAGSTRKVCVDKECPVHGRSRHMKVVDPTPEQIEAEKQRVKAQKIRERTEKQRKATFTAIMAHIPALLSPDQLRLLLRALAQSNHYTFDEIATYYVDQQNAPDTEEDEIKALDRIIENTEASSLPAILARFALTDHVDIPREGDTDYLTGAAVLFLPEDHAKPNTAKKGTDAKSKKARVRPNVKAAAKHAPKKTSPKRKA